MQFGAGKPKQCDGNDDREQAMSGGKGFVLHTLYSQNLVHCRFSRYVDKARAVAEDMPAPGEARLMLLFAEQVA